MSKFLTLTLLCVLICPLLTNAQPPVEVESRRKALNDLLAEQWNTPCAPARLRFHFGASAGTTNWMIFRSRPLTTIYARTRSRPF